MVFLLSICLKSFVPQVTPDREASVPTTNLLYSLPLLQIQSQNTQEFWDTMKRWNLQIIGREEGEETQVKDTHTQTFS